ncbi:elongation factor G-like protein EF-G2 [Streptomyces europaeiscabiei]|uniref:Elongation factor G-like protein EF-G2 n=1 Tax=Streptomyces europaeiscabiei TaxID=146819 RepID=A0ABU4NMH4_9ACTN|nr:elongation factor G-like protein EF-G2 [Streptomyces europaeiscabiei]MDX2769588.1 elongation factor G-like protein EF-G2 [Streptomyces europaeiscabiei]MDX3546942.1 elongation factor G-like protein EF-G2 [Streptomyces europaeiscabiei]MDX3556635.1 elongation factor G-like protein EF-G2 [Streptomyces europaeiscabiei]MDX3668795.1 elongation factor G-like protein EF-G2 [Streptomyces europaeiscabiei]MDX3704343.1 elongation factor G-like protein EF-G2 [Streptomyces europaeiscabiei]
MGDKANAHPGAAGRATAADHPASVRNVVLVGHSGSGKTTLVEALALTAGAVNRAGRVEDGGTVSDYDEIEHRQQRSVQLSLVPVEWGGYKINLLDTPGYADFVGELRAGLRAADAALFVVSASDGVDGSTRMVWEECAAVGMPRAIVVTHLEAARADFEEMTRICAETFGGDDPDAVLPLYLPLHGPQGPDGHAPVTGLTGLLSQKLFDYSSGERKESEPGPEQLPAIEEARNRLIEGIIAESEDETLMDRYLGGEEIDVTTLVDDLERAVARGVFHPVLAAAPAADGAKQGLGTVELLELVTGGFPTPLERETPAVTTPEGTPREIKAACDPDGPLVAEVVKTASDPYVGRISLVRVFSGTLHPDETVHVSGHGLTDRGHEDHDVDERIGALSTPFGKQQRTLTHCIAGDLACVAKLNRAETGDTLSAKDDPLLMEPWEMPDPLLPLAIQAHSKADEDKLSQGLARLVAEDPTMRLEQNQDTHQVVLWCLGEAHADVALERLRSRYGVQVDVVPHRVSLRETFADRSAGRGRHVKQSGGHGQYAICEIEVEPLPGGSGIEFVDKVVGGAVPRQFIPSVEKGVRAQAAKGVAAGYPLIDVRITLRDGKAHSVDSSDAAFQTAGALALREAAVDAKIHLLEPVAEVSVLVGDSYVGPVMSDLSGRRGRVVGTEQAGGGRTLVRAEVPEIEIDRYAVDLRSLSHGTARFGRRYTRHEPMPSHVAEKVREQTKEH